MSTEAEVKALQDNALEAASRFQGLIDTPETRAAYARGVRAMAHLVHAAILVTEDCIEDNSNHPLALTMLRGYAKALHNILDASEGLIPPGYE